MLQLPTCEGCEDGAADDGTSSEDDGGIELGNDGGAGAGGEDACAEVQISFEQQTPTVVLLIDQSGSMDADFGTGDRWTSVYDALLDPVDGVVAKLQGGVRFGMTLYTSAGGNDGGTCPMLQEVNPALDNYEALNTLYSGNSPQGDTPTGESLTPVADLLAADLEPGPKVIVLATDGEPDSCAVPNPQEGQPEATAGAEYAYLLGVETYVISVGGQVSAEHLQHMANAGVGLPIDGNQNAPYYEALDPQSLVDHFETIINGVRDCVLTLEGEIDPDLANQGTVMLDSEKLGYNHPDGWKVNSSTEIELVGAACDAIQSGDHAIDVSFPCGAVIN